MNTVINNPAIPVAAMNRPVTALDIAAALHMNPNTVRVYLGNNSCSARQNSPAIHRVREYAKQVGYDPQAAKLYAIQRWKETRKAAKERKLEYYYCNGNFHTKEEEVARMKQLRAEGFSNMEIARKIGRSLSMVGNYLGSQDPVLSTQNRAMASHIRAQKNAARKQYVLNRPILEYNAKVEEHNKLKAKVVQMEAELKPKTPIIEKAAQMRIDFPLVNLSTLKPTALQ